MVGMTETRNVVEADVGAPSVIFRRQPALAAHIIHVRQTEALLDIIHVPLVDN